LGNLHNLFHDLEIVWKGLMEEEEKKKKKEERRERVGERRK
jgi:hypothetical protein